MENYLVNFFCLCKKVLNAKARVITFFLSSSLSKHHKCYKRETENYLVTFYCLCKRNTKC